jgi:hypothetical protein
LKFNALRGISATAPREPEIFRKDWKIFPRGD